MNIYKLISALILALILMAVFFIGALVSRILNLLPSPWDMISNGALVLTGLTAIIYIWMGKLKRRKEYKMTKHYFVSYIHLDGATTTYGNCVVGRVDTDLTGLLQKIKDVNNFKNRPVILCLKDLSQEEYEMLRGSE